MKGLIAQRQYVNGVIRGEGPLGINPQNAPDKFSNFLSTFLGVLTVVAAIWLIFTLITGAIQWIGAGADKGAVESARKRITTGIIGIVIVVAALFIVDIIGQYLGFYDILDIGGYIQMFSP